MGLLFGFGLAWCIAMFIAVALCRAATSQDLREQVGDLLSRGELRRY